MLRPTTKAKDSHLTSGGVGGAPDHLFHVPGRGLWLPSELSKTVTTYIRGFGPFGAFWKQACLEFPWTGNSKVIFKNSYDFMTINRRSTGKWHLSFYTISTLIQIF